MIDIFDATGVSVLAGAMMSIQPPTHHLLSIRFFIFFSSLEKQTHQLLFLEH